MPNQLVLAERRERLFQSDTHLRKGAGHGINGGFDACLMQAVDWLSGGNGSTDAPSCASVVIRRYGIRLNDSLLFKEQEHRDMLKKFAPKIVGTAASRAVEVKRGFIAADYACRVFAPIWLEATGREDWAKEARSLPEVTNKKTAQVARNLLGKIRAATYAAHDAATYAAYAAAAAAAAAADAADAAHDAAHDAAYAYAAYAAAAADAAHDAAYARRKVLASYGDQLRTAALECLDRMIACTES